MTQIETSAGVPDGDALPDAPVGLLRLDHDACIVAANAAARDLLGL